MVVTGAAFAGLALGPRGIPAGHTDGATATDDAQDAGQPPPGTPEPRAGESLEVPAEPVPSQPPSGTDAASTADVDPGQGQPADPNPDPSPSSTSSMSTADLPTGPGTVVTGVGDGQGTAGR